MAFAEKIAPGASARDRERRLPFDELRDLSGSGLLGITVPKDYGGLAVSKKTLVEIFSILSAADPAIGQIPQNHFVFVRALEVEGSPWQKKFFFDRVLRGDQFGNALSERGTKTVLEFKTRIRPERRGCSAERGQVLLYRRTVRPVDSRVCARRDRQARDRLRSARRPGS